MGVADTVENGPFPPIVNAHHVCHLILVITSVTPDKIIQTLGLLSSLTSDKASNRYQTEECWKQNRKPDYYAEESLPSHPETEEERYRLKDINKISTTI